MSDRIVAIGERDQVRGFRGVGVEVVPVKDAAEAGEMLRRHALDPAVAVVLIAENTAAEIGPALAEARARSRAMILLIPSHLGTRHTSLTEMKSLIERSIGVDMIGKVESE